MNPNLPEEKIFTLIYEIRGHKVMLDSDLAEMYGVETKQLKRAVRRNMNRFPEDFMFELTEKEGEDLRHQIGTSRNWGGSRYAPFAFTEQGVAMLSSVLHSQQAIDVNIHIMRVFVKVRSLVAGYSELLEKIKELQNSDAEQNEAIKNLYRVFKELIEQGHKDRKQIGYKKEDS